MSRPLLLISPDPIDETFSKAVAAHAGIPLVWKKTQAEGLKFIVENELTIVFLLVATKNQFELFEKTIQDTVGLFSPKVNPNWIHFLSSEDIDQASYLVKSPLFGHFVYKNYQTHSQEAGDQYGRVVKATLLERAFGLQEMVGAKVKVQTVRLGSSVQKSDAVEAVKGFLVKAQYQNRMASIVANAVDELLLNAIYDAPVDEIGKPLYNQLARSNVLSLEGKSAVEMQVAFDGKYAAVSVVDQFGSIAKAKLLSHISKFYVTDEYKVKTSVAGAGIGLATIFQMGGSFFFVCEAGVKTQVTIFFKREQNYKLFKRQFRFLSTQFYM